MNRYRIVHAGAYRIFELNGDAWSLRPGLFPSQQAAEVAIERLRNTPDGVA